MATISSVCDIVKFCINVILKEAREETRLVKQILYIMLSMYGNNPINLAINAPPGEGKNYIIKKVGELFPQEDVIYLAGLSEKALYHRHGTLVVKNPKTGKYESIEERLEELDSQIQNKESEALTTENRDLKRSLRNDIKDLMKQKRDLVKDARNLIDLSHKTLVLLDTPSRGLFAAIMSLLSHDHWEVEYEFANTSNNGISTKVNVLRGWPSVIFAQAIDYSNYKRWPEVQRRFIITNPNMDSKKYDAAINLLADRFGLPYFAYGAKVVSQDEKEEAREMIREIKQGLLELSNQAEPGENNVIIPFITPLNKSLARQKASDMTMGYRLFSFLSLLPQINFYSRPYLQVTDPSRRDLSIKRMPFALFEDLEEAMYLMEYADGVRPYILMWYHQVFLPTYNAKTEPDSKIKKIKNDEETTITENIIAITTKQLAEATESIQNKIMSKTQIRENLIEPLINQGYIDKTDSEIDKRSDIYYPVILKIEKSNGTGNPCNFSQGSKIQVLDPAIFPNKIYLKKEISTIYNYTIPKGLESKIISSDKKEITIEELVDQYYTDAENYFVSPKTDSKIVYSQNVEKGNGSQQNIEGSIESTDSGTEDSKKLHGTVDPSNLFKLALSPFETVTCPYCGITLDHDPYWQRIHRERCLQRS